jgi:hypothetical protein
MTDAAALSALNGWELSLLLALGLVLTFLTSELMPRVSIPEARLGIVELQVAATAKRARRLTDAWSRRGMLGAVRLNLAFDYAFLLAYAATIAIACLLIERAAMRSGLVGDDSDLGTVAAALALGAGAFDLVENLAMRPLLEEEAKVGQLRVAAVFAAACLKFMLLATALLWVVIAGVASFVAALT